MYNDLVKSLRICARAEREYECDGCSYRNKGFECNSIMKNEAADAIAELSKRWFESERDATNLTGELATVYAKLPRWISVEEALPTVDQEVIVLAYGNMMRIWNLHRLDPETADVCWECEDGTLDDVCVVTHWMPLPEPPKEEG